MKVERTNRETDIPAYKGIQVTLGIMHTHLFLSGAADLVLGVFIISPSHSRITGSKVSDLWMLGVPLLLSGAFGYIVTCRPSYILVSLWSLFTVTSNTASFLYLALTHQMSPELFGVNIYVYGQCQTSNDTCLCYFPLRYATGLIPSSCEDVKYRTTICLLFITIYILALATLIIAVFLALTLSFWLPRCNIQEAPNRHGRPTFVKLPKQQKSQDDNVVASTSFCQPLIPSTSTDT